MRTALIFLLCCAQALAHQVGDKVALTFTEPKNAKLILVDFWASWCAPCRHSFVWMNQMHDKYAAKGLHIVAINVDKDKAQAEKFLAKQKANFALAYDPLGALAKQFVVSTMPSSYFLSPEGQVIAINRGFTEAEGKQSEALIQKYLP